MSASGLAIGDVLCVVDCDYLYGAARELYGNNSRVSFLKVKELVETRHHTKSFLDYHAFLALKSSARDQRQLQLVSRLSGYGYTVHTGTLGYDQDTGRKHRDDMREKIIAFIKEYRRDGRFPEILVVASSSMLFADLYDVLLYQGVCVEVITFGPLNFSLYGYVKMVSENIIVGEELLYTPYNRSS